MRIDAQDLAGTALEENGRRFVMQFRDEHGQPHSLSLPVPIAIAMKDVLIDLESTAGFSSDQTPSATKNVQHCVVGDSEESPLVTMRINRGVIYSMSLSVARSLSAGLLKRAELVAQRIPRRTN